MWWLKHATLQDKMLPATMGLMRGLCRHDELPPMVMITAARMSIGQNSLHPVMDAGMGGRGVSLLNVPIALQGLEAIRAKIAQVLKI